MHQTIDATEERTLQIAACWLSQALDDLAHQQSNVTRMRRLYQAGELELGAFMEATRRAWSIVVPKVPTLRRPAAYFFRVLEGELVPQVGMSAKQAQAVAYGA